MKYINYLKYLIKHKWFVFLECLKYGLIWRGIIHDWSKFLPDEFFPYVEHFYGKKNYDIKSGFHEPGEDKEFDLAWKKHQTRNDHHFQFWILLEDQGTMKPLEMSNKAKKEMICDWKSAGRVQGNNDTLGWYIRNRFKITLAQETRRWVERELRFTSRITCTQKYKDYIKSIEFPELTAIEEHDRSIY